MNLVTEHGDSPRSKLFAVCDVLRESGRDPTRLVGDRQHGGGSVRIGGEIDPTTAPTAERAARRLKTTDRVNVLDVWDVSFTDLSRLPTILGADRRIRALGGRPTAADGTPPSSRLLDLAHAARRRQIRDHAGEAVAQRAGGAADRLPVSGSATSITGSLPSRP